MNAEQPPLNTPTRFLLECNAAGYFPPVNEDPVNNSNRCMPLTPPWSNQQHSNTSEQHPYAQHVFTTPYYPSHVPLIPTMKQQYRQPPTPPAIPSSFDQTPFVTSNAAITTSTPTISTNISSRLPLQTSTTNTIATTQQLELPPSPPKSTTTIASTTVGRKRRASEHFDEDEEEHEQRKKLLERNRVAASKCRQKKKKWMQELEIRSEKVSSRNKELQDCLAHLREESMFLRNQLLTHNDCNCTMVQTYLQRSSARLTLGNGGHTSTAAAAADTVSELMSYPENHYQTNTGFPSSSSSPPSSHRSSPETF
ncbi:hypothetical protein BDC45DRAFT_610045 [Circinella umbellata]|nr:hypothetical protein BDC45DRAFT_610045 [Circinella umbellata]